MILVTGGAGYIGSHVVKMLKDIGYGVVVYDSLENGHLEAVRGVDLVEGDLRDRALLEATFNINQIEAVMHFAAYASVGDSVINPSKYFDNNIVGGLNLVEAMREHDVGKIIFSSSAAVYGEPQHVPIEESHPKNPTNPYGESKLMFENILKWYDTAYGTRSISLRYFNASGSDPDGTIGENHSPEEHLIPIVLQAALGQRESVSVFGTDWDTPDGTCIRDYIHVVDLADAHVRALHALENGAETTVYNLGNGDGHSVKQVIEIAGEVVGQPIRWVAAGRRPGDPARLVAGSERIKSELGWQPKYADLRTIIAHAWRWHAARH